MPEVVFTPSPKLEEPINAAAQAEAEEQARGYRIGTWHGIPNYECLVCPFASTDQMAVDVHVAEHRVRRYGVPVDTGLVGPSGQPIVRIEEQEG